MTENHPTPDRDESEASMSIRVRPAATGENESVRPKGNSRRALRRLTYANVTSSLALFLALGGGAAWAANEFTGANIKNETITGVDIKGSSSVDGTLTTGDIKNGSLLKRDFKAGQLPAGPQGPKGDQGDPGPSTGPAGGDLSGTYPNPQIGPNKVNGGKVAGDSLDGSDIAEASLAKVPSAADSDSLGGKPASDFAQRCKQGSIGGYARIYAPGLPTDGSPVGANRYGGEVAYNCSGGSISIRRVSTGRYEVTFANTNFYAAAFANGDAYGYGPAYIASTTGPFGDGKVEVRIDNNAGAPTDPYYFNVAVLSNG